MTRTPTRARFLTTVLLLACAAVSLSPAWRDGDRAAVAQDRPTTALIENPNTAAQLAEAKNRINKAEQARVDGNNDAARALWLEAFERLQGVFAEDRYRDHWVPRIGTVGRYIGAREYARELVLSGGEFAQLVYEDRYNSNANHLMREARLNRSVAPLQRIAQHYPFTSTGLTAIWMLAQHHWEAGRFSAAASLLMELRDRPRLDDGMRADVAAMLGETYARLGLPDEAAALASDARHTMPDATAMAGGKERPLHELLADATNRAARLANSPETQSMVRNYGGNHRGNQASPGPFTPSAVRWTRNHAPSRAISTENFYLDYSNYDPGFVRRVPAVDSGMVFVPNRYNVRACNLFSGAVEWDFTPEYEFSQMRYNAEQDQNAMYTISVFDDRVFAPLDRPYPREVRVDRPLWGTSVVVVTPPRRELFVLDRNTGEKLWSVGGRYDQEATADAPIPLHERMSYALAPIVVGDTVYCPASRLGHNGIIYIVALDRDGERDANGIPTGRAKVKWISQMAAGQKEINMFGRPTREPFPTAVVYGNNMVYICTNLGVVGAVDARTGEHRWASTYEVTDFYQPISPTAVFRTTTWFANPPMLVGGTLIVTPTDGPTMVAFDAVTGERKWDFGFPGLVADAQRYLLGVYENQVVITGASKLACVNLHTGRLTTEVPLYSNGRSTSRVYGRGAIAGKYAYVPLSGELVQIDLDRLTRVGTVNVPGMLRDGANLVAAGSVMVLVSDDDNSRAITCSYDWEAIIRALKQEANRNPNDVAIALRLANLTWQSGDTEAAIEQFERVLRIAEQSGDPEGEKARHAARRALFNIHVEQAETARARLNWPVVGRAIAKAREFLDAENSDEAIALLLLEVEYNRHQNPAEVEATYRRLIESYGTLMYSFPDAGTARVAVYALVKMAEQAEAARKYDRALEHWQSLMIQHRNESYSGALVYSLARERMLAIFSRAGRVHYAAIERRVRALYDEAISANPVDVGALEGIVANYPLSETAADALRALATRAIDQGQFELATEYLRRLLREYPTAASRALIYLDAIDVYEQQEMFHAARTLYRQLEREHGTETVTWRDQRIAVGAYVKERLASAPYSELDASPNAVSLKMPLEEAWNMTFSDNGAAKVLNLTTPIHQDYSSQFYVHLQGNKLEARSTRDGHVLWDYRNIVFVYAAGYTQDGSLVLVTRQAVVAVNAGNGKELWRVEFDVIDIAFEVQAASIAEDMVGIILRVRSPVDRQYRFHVGVIDARTGTLIGTSREPILDNIYSAPIVRDGMLVCWSENVAMVFGFALTAPEAPLYTLNYREHEGDRKRLSAPVLVGNDRFAVTVNDTDIYVHTIVDGAEVSRYQSRMMRGATLYANESMLFITSRPDTTERLTAIDAAMGTEIWSTQYDGIYRRAVLTNSDIAIARQTRDSEAIVDAFDIQTGDRLWSRSLGVNNRWSCQDDAVTTKHVMFGMRQYVPVTEDGRTRNRLEMEMFFIDRESGTLTQHLVPDMGKSIVPSILFQDNGLFVCAGEVLYCYRNNR